MGGSNKLGMFAFGAFLATFPWWSDLLLSAAPTGDGKLGSMLAEMNRMLAGQVSGLFQLVGAALMMFGFVGFVFNARRGYGGSYGASSYRSHRPASPRPVVSQEREQTPVAEVEKEPESKPDMTAPEWRPSWMTVSEPVTKNPDDLR